MRERTVILFFIPVKNEGVQLNTRGGLTTLRPRGDDNTGHTNVRLKNRREGGTKRKIKETNMSPKGENSGWYREWPLLCL